MNRADSDELASKRRLSKSTRDSELPKKGDKKLSFFHNDDDESDDYGDSSPSSRLPQPKLTNNVSKGVITDAYNNNNGRLTKKNNEIAHISNTPDYKLSKVAQIVHHDASSPSSCSCEDHSSVADQSDDLHEDLDYDDDSIASSPREASGNGEMIQEPTTSSSTNNDTKEISPASPAKSSQNQLEETQDKPQRTHGEDSDHNPTPPRMKSVINFNRNDDRGTQNLTVSDCRSKTSNDRVHKSYECLLKYFFKDACFFQIKSINHENVALSKSLGVWSTPVQNEIRLNAAFQEHRNVILIFSVQQSGAFQGFARMVSESRPATRPIPWVLPERLSNRSLGGVLKVEWLCTEELSFQKTHHLYNPFNSNKPVKVARDGQQVEPKIGKKLCKLFPHDSKRRLLSCISTLKRQTSQRKKSTFRHDNFYPLNSGRRVYPNDWQQHRLIHETPIRGMAPEMGEYVATSHEFVHCSPHNIEYRLEHGMFNTFGHPAHQRQNFPPSHIGPSRYYNMPRDMNHMPRRPMQRNFGEFHPYQRPRR